MGKKNFFLYGSYVIVLVVFFVYYLFPTERLKAFVVMQVQRINPELRMTVGKVGLMFPPGLRLQRVQVDVDNTPLLLADDLAILPHLKTLLSARDLYSFRMKTHEGTITGTAEIGGTRQATIDAVASGLKLNRIPLLKRLSAEPVEGVLDGTFAYAAAAADKPQTINIKVNITKMAITLATPFFMFNEIRFEKVQADAVLRHQHLEIMRVVLTGDQIEGHLAGSASLSKDIMQSILNLNGTVMPQKQFLDNSGVQVPGVFLTGLKAGGGIPIRISGPLDDLRLETR